MITHTRALNEVINKATGLKLPEAKSWNTSLDMQALGYGVAYMASDPGTNKLIGEVVAHSKKETEVLAGTEAQQPGTASLLAGDAFSILSERLTEAIFAAAGRLMRGSLSSAVRRLHKRALLQSWRKLLDGLARRDTSSNTKGLDAVPKKKRAAASTISQDGGKDSISQEGVLTARDKKKPERFKPAATTTTTTANPSRSRSQTTNTKQKTEAVKQGASKKGTAARGGGEGESIHAPSHIPPPHLKA